MNFKEISFSKNECIMCSVEGAINKVVNNSTENSILDSLGDSASDPVWDSVWRSVYDFITMTGLVSRMDGSIIVNYIKGS